MSVRVVIFRVFLALALFLPTSPARALTNGVALLPPMGFNSWYNYGAGGANEALIKSIADTMATNGMLAAGYQHINIDDGWPGFRDANGNIVADTNKFPDGMKAMADYIHAKGFKFGLYTTAGSNTCAGYPASANHFAQDAATYAAWGVDYLKYEGCGVTIYETSPRQQIYCARMQQALAHCGRPIVFSCSVSGFENWMPQYINLFRGTGDVDESWPNIVAHIDYVAQTPTFAGPGQWNDPDVLEIGSGFFSETESVSIFSMWCILASPLLNLSKGEGHTNILCNPEAIAVDQDAACLQGICVATNGNLQVWRKWMGAANANDLAVVLFNRGTNDADITANWSDLGLLPGVATVRDIWARAYAGNATNSYTAHVPGHGVKMLRLNYGATLPRPPVGTNYLSAFGWLADITNQYTLIGNVPIELNLAASATPLTLHGVHYTNGLGFNAYTRASYFLGGGAARFQSDIGVDDHVAPYGSSIFRVYADGTKIYDSGILSNASPTQTIDADVTGKNILTLEVSVDFPGGQNGCADWANARVTALPLPPSVPAGLSAIAGNSQFVLTWYAAFGATNYNLKRSTTAGGNYTIIASLSSPGFTDTNIAINATYYYVVSAVNANGESANSPELSVSVPFYWTNVITANPQDWNVNSNWTNTTVFPNSIGAFAVLGDAIASNQTIRLNQNITFGSLVIGATNGAAAYSIVGNGGTLIFNNDQNPVTITATASSAGDSIAAAIALNGNLAIKNSSGNQLSLAGAISGNSALTLSGGGPLFLGASNTFSGPVTLAQGMLKIGNAAALGATNNSVAIAAGATVELNGFSLSNTFTVSGTGVNNHGAFINSAVPVKPPALQNVTLAGDTTFGGSTRWDLRGALDPIVSASLSAGGQAFNLTKTGSNQISITAAKVDAALGNVNVQQGILSLESTTTSLGNPANSLTVATGATLAFFQTVTPWNKQFALNGDGVTATFVSSGGSNLLIGPVTLNGSCLFGISNGALTLNGPIAGSGSLTKNLSGRLGLCGTNSYTGGSTVNSGTLALLNSNAAAASPQFTIAPGALLDVTAINPGWSLTAGHTLSGGGAVSGNVTVGGGALLAPSNSFGTLTFSNSLTFASGSACLLQVNRTPVTNELIRVAGTMNCGGTLIVSNVSAGGFASGDSFRLFNAAASTGAFQIVPVIPGPNLVWDTSTFLSNGILRVAAGATPHFTGIVRQGNNIVFHGAGGTVGAPYYILTTTNFTLPVNQWTRLATNQFDASGNFAVTNALTNVAAYFLLQFP